jgi:hypothetical protein
MNPNRKAKIQELIHAARNYRFCGPSDDPDEQTAVTAEYRSLVVQLKRLAGPILPLPCADRLEAINVDVDDLRSAYAADDEIKPLLFDIEDALEHVANEGMTSGSNRWIVESSLVTRIEELKSKAIDVGTLARMCREINSSYAHGNILATLLLMRTVLNHVPSVFGHETFEQVAAHTGGKSLKISFDHLETGLRNVADFHAHRRITSLELYPSVAQVEPFKPDFEQLLHEVVKHVTKNPDGVSSPERRPERKPLKSAAEAVGDVAAADARFPTPQLVPPKSRLRDAMMIVIAPVSRSTSHHEYFLEKLDEMDVLIRVPSGEGVRIPKSDFVESWDDACLKPKLMLTRKYFQGYFRSYEHAPEFFLPRP